MKVERLRILPNLLAIILMLVAFAANAVADTRPYLKTYGGDVMTGGNYNNVNTCDTSPSSNYQDPNTVPVDSRRGGILTYINTSRGGASGQYGVLSVGQIENNGGAGYGFYSGGNLAGLTSLTFANTSGAGLFDGANRQLSSCIPDYFSMRGTTQTLPTVGSTINAGGLASGKYYFKPDPASTINPGQDITIYIDGSITIDANITFAGNGNYSVDNLPKFAIVAKGDIFISKNVSQLDGAYISQPGAATSGAPNAGTVWTCTDPNNQANNKDSIWLAGNCNNRLTINGALIAQQVNFMRVKGDTAAALAEDAACAADAANRTAVASGNCANIAEIINYIPEMVIGGGTIGTTPGSTDGEPASSVKSLPPVF
jgi:hypothetical protein